jgi:hypothetical protein
MAALGLVVKVLDGFFSLPYFSSFLSGVVCLMVALWVLFHQSFTP